MQGFRLAPTPAHFSDAEISGLFRMLDQRDERDLFADDIAAERSAHEREREELNR